MERVKTIDNIILFPEKRIKYPKRVGAPFNLEIIGNKILLGKKEQVDVAAEHLFAYIVDYLKKNKFNLDKNIKEQAMFSAALFCFMRSSKGLTHILQPYVEELIQLDSEGNPSIKQKEVKCVLE